MNKKLKLALVVVGGTVAAGTIGPYLVLGMAMGAGVYCAVKVIKEDV